MFVQILPKVMLYFLVDRQSDVAFLPALRTPSATPARSLPDNTLLPLTLYM